MNYFNGIGNLGKAPHLRTVNVGDEVKYVMDYSVYIVHRKDKGFWLKASLWGKKALNAANVLKAGMLIHVTGELYFEEWTDKKTGETRRGFRLETQDIAIDPLNFIEREKQE